MSKRVLLKLSGESFADSETNFGISPNILNRIANNFIRLLFLIRYNDVTNAFKAYKKEVLEACNPIISQHFNINAELSLKSIILRILILTQKIIGGSV